MSVLLITVRPAPEAFLEGGTQYISGPLSFIGSVTIKLSPDVFTAPGKYILFDYSEGTFAGGQAALNNQNYDDSELPLLQVRSVVDDTANKRVVLTLASKTDNGTQYVQGDLAITGPLTVMLPADLYGSAGTYTLFDWSGGGTFSDPSQVANITCVVAKPNLSVRKAPYVDGSTIKVVLA